ncbi:MAG: hypothetical protein QME79_09845 [Bacillota bacterium]|nr:hypothetical protein [Bacillota bacterium]
MILVDQDDVLRGLKRCKRLAKQALLASGLTADPSFWTAQAEARRLTYDDLMARIQENGLEPTYAAARARYEQLTSPSTPTETGERQALEMFFTILGVGAGETTPRAGYSSEVVTS